MNTYSSHSRKHLKTCHLDLQRVFEAVLPHFDHTIIEGHRGEAKQDRLHAEGKSQLEWPDSRHNASPSMAVDAIPYPIDWDDRERMTYFAGFVLGIAASMGITLRWGGDWDRDTEVKDNRFDDLVHFEIPQ